MKEWKKQSTTGWKTPAIFKQRGPEQSTSRVNKSDTRDIRQQLLYAEQTCISKARQLCINGLFLLTAPPPPLLKHSIQDYAANLSRRLQRPLSIHPGLLMALCRFCEVFQFQGQVNGIKYCMQLITQSNVLPYCSSVGFEKEKWQEHIKNKKIKKDKKRPLWFQH